MRQLNFREFRNLLGHYCLKFLSRKSPWQKAALVDRVVKRRRGKLSISFNLLEFFWIENNFVSNTERQGHRAGIKDAFQREQLCDIPDSLELLSLFCCYSPILWDMIVGQNIWKKSSVPSISAPKSMLSRW